MAGFLLLPLKQQILEGKLHQMDDHVLATLVVLIAHESARTRIACPSQDRIAILAGVSQHSVASAVSALTASGWLQKSRLPASGGRTRFQYRMAYARYQNGDTSGRWLRLGSYVVLNGIWAAMPPSARRLYLALLSLSWSGSSMLITEENQWDWFLERRDSGAGYFVDARYLAPSELRRLAGIEPRTFTRAWAWLKDENLLEPVSDDSDEDEISECRDGVLLANLPDHYAPAVLARLARLKKEVLAVPPDAKQLLRHTRRTSEGKNTTKKTQRGLPQTRRLLEPDTTAPEPVFEPVLNKTLTSPHRAGGQHLALVPRPTGKEPLHDVPPSFGGRKRTCG